MKETLVDGDGSPFMSISFFFGLAPSFPKCPAKSKQPLSPFHMKVTTRLCDQAIYSGRDHFPNPHLITLSLFIQGKTVFFAFRISRLRNIPMMMWPLEGGGLIIFLRPSVRTRLGPYGQGIGPYGRARRHLPNASEEVWGRKRYIESRETLHRAKQLRPDFPFLSTLDNAAPYLTSSHVTSDGSKNGGRSSFFRGPIRTNA